MNETDFVIEEMPPRHRKWGRIKAAVEASGVPRYRLYQLIRDGAIRTAVLRHKGKQRGMRLVDLDSLDAYIVKHATGPEA
jgi:hypothetical protein